MKHWLSPRPIQTVISKFSGAVFKKGCPVFPLPPSVFSRLSSPFRGGYSEGVDIAYRGLRFPLPPFSATPIARVGEGAHGAPEPQHPQSQGRRKDLDPGRAGEDVYIQEINYFTVYLYRLPRNDGCFAISGK